MELRRLRTLVRHPFRTSFRLGRRMRWAAAEARVVWASRFAPESGRVWAQRAELHLRLGDAPRALAAAQVASRLIPHDFATVRVHAKSLEAIGEHDAATRLWADRAEAVPEDAEVRCSAAHELFRLAEYEMAGRALNEIEPGPDSLPQVELLTAALRLFNGEDAGEDLIAAVQQAASDPPLRRLVAARLAERGKVQPAWEVLSVAPEVSLPGDEMVELVRQLDDVPGLERAIARVEDERAGQHTRPSRSRRVQRELLMRRGVIAYEAKQWWEAAYWFERATVRTSPTRRTLLWLAKAHNRLGRVDDARRFAEDAHRRSPDWAPPLALLGEVYEGLGDQDASSTYWQRLLDSGSTSPVHLHRGWRSLDRATNHTLAQRVAERLLDIDPDDPEALVSYALTLRKLGGIPSADDAIEKLLGRSDAQARRALVRFHIESERREDALEVLRDLPKEEQDLTSWILVGRRLRDEGHLSEALAVAREAIQVVGEDPRLLRLEATCSGEHAVLTGAWASKTRSSKPYEGTSGRVLHVVGKSHPYAQTGYTVRTNHTVGAQLKVGLDPHVVTQLGFPWNQGSVPLSSEELVDGVVHHRLGLPHRPGARLPLDQLLTWNVHELNELVARVRPSVLHAASDYRNALLALEVGERVGVPVIYEVRGFWEETWRANKGIVGDDRDSYRLRRDIELESVQRATHVVTLTDTMRRYLIDRGVDGWKISVVPNAVDADAFVEVERDAVLAERLGFSRNETVVGYVSSFSRYEGIEFLIDAVAKLRVDGRPVRGLLVGDGDVRDELEAQAEAQGVSDAITFTGRVPHVDVQSYYGLIDIFVVPRTNDRVCHLVSPLKPYEAMAAGIPLVVSGTDVLKDIIRDGELGLSFTPEDAGDLARCLAELIDEPALRERLARSARDRVLRHHTWERNATRYVEIYEGLGAV